ncbi:unnamed protein product [Pseudo-nitzschia multistriata]|uniref:Uncharacterized protein n=1 Tax=Pseudo-nitzschia multistriata TaxID=183589 RepID=A0A448Z4N1_9STRA|nr:unnamed protein product [Pseudo-nitzschia multistriata]
MQPCSSVEGSHVTQPLFGGAIACDLPAGWKDLSDVRPIPDNQECFQNSLVDENPIMLVVEILERQEQIGDQDAASFFFNELAERNDVLQTKNDIRFFTLAEPVLATALLGDASVVAGTNTVLTCAGYGYQKVAMGRDYDNAGNSRRENQEVKCIRVDLCVLRLQAQETDLLVTISRPVDDINLNEASLDSSSAESAILSQVISTFRIDNWGLFG